MSKHPHPDPTRSPPFYGRVPQGAFIPDRWKYGIERHEYMIPIEDEVPYLIIWLLLDGHIEECIGLIASTSKRNDYARKYDRINSWK